MLFRIFSTPFADFHHAVTQQLRDDVVSVTQSSLHGTDGMTQQLRDGGVFMTTCKFKFKIYSTESWLEAEVNKAIQFPHKAVRKQSRPGGMRGAIE